MVKGKEGGIDGQAKQSEERATVPTCMMRQLVTLGAGLMNTNEASGVGLPSEVVDGMRVIDRLPYLAVLTEPAERDPREVPQWFSANQITCPRCGRTDFGNVNQEALVRCSLCLANECLKADRAGIASAWKHPENHKVLPESSGFRIRLKANRSSRARICEKCKEPFRGRSNSQRYCESCQRGAYNDKTRVRMADFRKRGNGVSAVTK
jgi:hypothetical protein